MKVRNILDNRGFKVGVFKTLEGGGFAIEFHDIYMGVFTNFEAWNCQHGGIYKLEEEIVFSKEPINFEKIDIDLEMWDDEDNTLGFSAEANTNDLTCSIHSALISDGLYETGVPGKLDMDYNKGPTTWSNSHIITYANGKRTIVTMNGKK